MFGFPLIGMHLTSKDLQAYGCFLTSLAAVWQFEQMQTRLSLHKAKIVHAAMAVLILPVGLLSMIGLLGYVYLVGKSFRVLSLYTWSSMLIPLLVLYAGVQLWKFRERSRALYGASEVIAGLTLAAYTVWAMNGQKFVGLSQASHFPILIAELSSVYVIVRGLDNINTGAKGGDWIQALNADIQNVEASFRKTFPSSQQRQSEANAQEPTK